MPGLKVCWKLKLMLTAGQEIPLENLRNTHTIFLDRFQAYGKNLNNRQVKENFA